MPTVAAPNYFAWVRAQSKRCARKRDEQRLAQLITEVHTAQPAYGVQRVTRELQRRGVPVGRRVVARLMRALDMADVTRRKRRIERTSPAAELGARYRQVLLRPGRAARRGRLQDGRLESAPPPRVRRRRGPGPARPTGPFNLTELAPDRNRVTFALDLQPKA
jgi:hypothetical protein